MTFSGTGSRPNIHLLRAARVLVSIGALITVVVTPSRTGNVRDGEAISSSPADALSPTTSGGASDSAAGLPPSTSEGIAARRSEKGNGRPKAVRTPTSSSAAGQAPQPTAPASNVAPQPTPSNPVIWVAPSEIAPDCSRDVTDELLSWIASVPNGSTLRLHRGGCYLADGSLKVTDRVGLTLDGDGATIRSKTRGALDRQGMSQRRHVWFLDSREITIRNLAVEGTNTKPDQREGFGSYDVHYEFEHAFAFHNSHNVVLENLSVDAVWGDGLYLGNSLRSSTNVSVSGLTVDRNGRQGVAISAADGVLMEDVRILHSRRSGFDLEPAASDWKVLNVEIRNSYTNATGFAFAAGGRGDVSEIYLHDNVTDGPHGDVFVRASDGTRRRNWRIYDNRRLRAFGSPVANPRFYYVDNVDIRRNYFPVATTQSRSVNGLYDVGGEIYIIDNDLTGACKPYIADERTAPVHSWGNKLSDDC